MLKSCYGDCLSGHSWTAAFPESTNGFHHPTMRQFLHSANITRRHNIGYTYMWIQAPVLRRCLPSSLTIITKGTIVSTSIFVPLCILLCRCTYPSRKRIQTLLSVFHQSILTSYYHQRYKERSTSAATLKIHRYVTACQMLMHQQSRRRRMRSLG